MPLMFFVLMQEESERLLLLLLLPITARIILRSRFLDLFLSLEVVEENSKVFSEISNPIFWLELQL